MSLDKEKFADNFVKFVAGKPKKLTLEAVRQEEQTIEGKVIPTLVFKVTLEDNKEVEKEWSVTSKKLVNAMWGLASRIDKGEELDIIITRFGSSFDTYYEFAEIVDGKEKQKISTEKKE